MLEYLAKACLPTKVFFCFLRKLIHLHEYKQNEKYPCTLKALCQNAKRGEANVGTGYSHKFIPG